jgi:hypothetical protein
MSAVVPSPKNLETFDEEVKPAGFWRKFAVIAGKSLKIAALAVFGAIPAIIWGVGAFLLLILVGMPLNFVVGVVGTAASLFAAIAATLKSAFDSLNSKVTDKGAVWRTNFTPVINLFLNSMIRTLSLGTVFSMKEQERSVFKASFPLTAKADTHPNILLFLVAFIVNSVRDFKCNSSGDKYHEGGKTFYYDPNSIRLYPSKTVRRDNVEVKDILKGFREKPIIPFARVIGCIKNEAREIQRLARGTGGHKPHPLLEEELETSVSGLKPGTKRSQ